MLAHLPPAHLPPNPPLTSHSPPSPYPKNRHQTGTFPQAHVPLGAPCRPSSPPLRPLPRPLRRAPSRPSGRRPCGRPSGSPTAATCGALDARRQEVGEGLGGELSRSWGTGWELDDFWGGPVPVCGGYWVTHPFAKLGGGELVDLTRRFNVSVIEGGIRVKMFLDARSTYKEI